eukprot:TRINITY_DN33783_c0_g1_i1.p1 TRINITY_DN33783_c0_g1~~TRINITY_DN33783_c0_g1_i1.p1  ORF type:complete len:379 (+),score=47.24 TRINITY_DN33783_c0_g1_i1:54-1190(+)
MLAVTKTEDLDEVVLDPGDGGGPLPPMWGFEATQDGKMYFLNHWSKSTTWEDPRAPWAKPKAEEKTPCQAYIHGRCALADGCLFVHDKCPHQEYVDLDIQIIPHEATVKEEPEEIDSDLEGLQVDPSLWRPTHVSSDFHKSDKIRVAPLQISAEEYSPTQLRKLGSEGVVLEVFPGGHFVTIRHFDGAKLSWNKEDLLVYRAVADDDAHDMHGEVGHERKKKVHKWIKNHEARKRYEKENREWLRYNAEHERLNQYLMGRGRARGQRYTAYNEQPSTGRGRGRGSDHYYERDFPSYNQTPFETYGRGSTYGRGYSPSHSNDRVGMGRGRGFNHNRTPDPTPIGRGRGRGFDAYMEDYVPIHVSQGRGRAQGVHWASDY